MCVMCSEGRKGKVALSHKKHVLTQKYCCYMRRKWFVGFFCLTHSKGTTKSLQQVFDRALSCNNPKVCCVYMEKRERERERERELIVNCVCVCVCGCRRCDFRCCRFISALKNSRSSLPYNTIHNTHNTYNTHTHNTHTIHTQHNKWLMMIPLMRAI